MNKLVLNLVVAAALGFAGYKLATRYSSGNVPTVDFTSVDPSNQEPVKACRAQKTCVIAYVAPWCPACHQFVANLPQVRERLASRETGLLLIVGAESDMQKKVDFVRQLTPSAVLDAPGDTFLKAHKVGYFPTFIVTDSDGTVIAGGKKGRDKLTELLN